MTHNNKTIGWSNPTLRDAYHALMGTRPERFKNTDEPNSRRESCVYFIRAPKLAAIKIGTTTDLARRLKGLQHASAETLYLIGTIDGSYETERLMKERFKSWRVRGEWYSQEILPEVLDLVSEDKLFFSAA